MKIKIIYLTAVILLFLGCSKIEFDQIDPELQPYFDQFLKDAAARGIQFTDEELNITMNINNIVDPNILGLCQQQPDLYGAVSIDAYYWRTSTETTRQFIVYHELGHCILKRGHTDGRDSDGNCLSVMHSAVGICLFDFTGTKKEAYLDELFGK